MESWVALGEISPPPCPACCLMSQSCVHPAVPNLLPNLFGAALLLGYLCQVKMVQCGHHTASPHKRQTQKAMLILHLPQNKRGDSPSG